MSNYTLTPEHEAQLKPWGDKWLKIALSTEAMTDDDKRVCTEATHELYKVLGFKPPKEVLYVSSPMRGVIEATTRLAAAPLKGKNRNAFIEEVINYRLARAKVRLNEVAFDKELDDVKLSPKAQELLKNVPTNVSDLYNGGNLWAGTVSYISFFRHIAKLEIDWTSWVPYELLAEHAGPRFMHEDFCIICDRPSVLKLDERLVAHCPDGPTHAWRDGFELYHWRGTQVPAAWINAKDTVDPASVLACDNIERRRAGTEIIGWARILEGLNAKVIDKNPNPQVGTLLEVDLPESPSTRFLRVVCGTGREFAIPVGSEFGTALEANAATYGLTPDELLKLEVRT
jgi:hypothetical protein